jgi:hypothetical protein
LESFFATIKENEVQLTHLRLRDIENLTSAHLKMIAQSKASSSLVHFDISECNRVTSDGLFHLAEECIHLHTLLLAYQNGVTNRAIRVSDHCFFYTLSDSGIHSCLFPTATN